MSHQLAQASKSKDIAEVIDISDDEENVDPAPPVAAKKTSKAVGGPVRRIIAPLGVRPTTTALPHFFLLPYIQYREQWTTESQGPSPKKLQSGDPSLSAKEAPVLKSVRTENGDPAEEILRVVSELCQDPNLAPLVGQHLVDFEEEERRLLGGNPTLKLKYFQIEKIMGYHLFNLKRVNSGETGYSLRNVYTAFESALRLTGPILRQRVMESLDRHLGFTKKKDMRVPLEALRWNLEQIIHWLYYEGGEEIRRKNRENRYKPY